MVYLVAKIFVLLVLAAVCGFVLGRWWVRRQFKDVSEEYAKLMTAGPMQDYGPALDSLKVSVDDGQTQVSNLIRGIEGRLRDLVAAEISRARSVEEPSSDLKRIESGLAELTELSRAQSKLDLSSLESTLAVVQGEVQGLSGNASVDLAPVEARLAALEAAIEGLSVSSVDFDPMLGRVADLERALRDKPTPPDVDLGPLVERIAELDRRVQSVTRPSDVDLGALRDRLAAIDQRLQNWPRTTDVDMTPMLDRIARLEAMLETALTPPSPTPEPGPVLLKAATFGPKDDLKRISGVGKVLERLLNELGVYYFFQIASWSRADVEDVDSRLEAFKGRIERDDWVTQARKLARTSEAKPPPGLKDASFGLQPGARHPNNSVR